MEKFLDQQTKEVVTRTPSVQETRETKEQLLGHLAALERAETRIVTEHEHKLTKLREAKAEVRSKLDLF